MARNIEVKARIDSLPAVRARLAPLPCHGEHYLYQTDTFFHVARGRLKLREFADGAGELIFYERPDEAGPKLSQYDRIPCRDAAALLHALTAALGVRGVIKKRRQVVLIGNTRVHLDEVEGLGSFLEVEVVLEDSDTVAAGERTAAELLQALAIPRSNLISGAYLDLLEQGQVSSGARLPTHAVAVTAGTPHNSSSERLQPQRADGCEAQAAARE